mgnify:CR=1 FL=1
MVIIIPCYNEYNRLDKNAFTVFLKKNIEVKIVFSNDASSDNTLNLLKEIQSDFKSQVFICNSQTNRGKAEAVRHGVLYAFDQQVLFNRIGYLDADLSVSLEECLELSTQLDKKCLFVFGSRISIINNTIVRSDFRHYTGRIVATIIANLLKIKVYDTQCGCKIFDSKLAKIIFQEPFISRWLFDVELFFRIIKLYSREELKKMSLEIPLKTWIDTGGSKVKISYFFKLWQDLYLIKKHYSGV